MKELGSRIRKERKLLNLTLEDLARLTGTSKATLQRIEKGSKSPSVALLAEISNILRKPIDDLIGHQHRSFYKLNGGEQKLTVTEAFEMTMVCPFGLISRDMVINAFKAPAGAFVKPHQDKGHEWVYVIEGSCVFEYDGKPHELRAGDVIFYDASHTHSVRMLSDIRSIDIFIRR